MLKRRENPISSPENLRKSLSKNALKDVEELMLPNSKLKFCSEQLQNLNYIFHEKIAKKLDEQEDETLNLAKSVTERLVQRLLCSIGVLDPRFSSKFLISLNDRQDTFTPKLKYLVRLDNLSKPALYPGDDIPKYYISEGDLENCPAGYARIRLHASSLRNWMDFANPCGYVRRDKIQARFVELLAQAAASEFPSSPLEVDESTVCGSPGKIVDAAVLHRILHTSCENHVFYGPQGNAPQFPDPRDFKLAIVDEPNGIKLRVGFLSSALSSIAIQVRLLVAIGLDAWPSTTNFPFRVPLGHSDSLLYQRAAQTGMYLVGFGVHSLAWQMRMPAAESVLIDHYGSSSTVLTVNRILQQILQEIDEQHTKYEISHRILNKYIIRSSLFFELENDNSSPTVTIMNWSPKQLSTRILRILDKLTKFLRHERQPNYFFLSANLLVNPGHLCNDDFFLEAKKLHAYLLKCFDESLVSLRKQDGFKRFYREQKAELNLLLKWKELVENLTPPPATRGRRFCFSGTKLRREVVHAQYTTRQMEYIGILLKNMLTVKQAVLDNQSEYHFGWIENQPDQEKPIEDAIYILVTLIEQARSQYMDLIPQNLSKSRVKLKRQFELATAKLVEMVRKEDFSHFDPLDDAALVKAILRWLYKGLDQSKRHFAPVLRPYLHSLFVASHGVSWHLETVKLGDAEEELNALQLFAKLVNEDKITPAQGLIDCINKNWEWAKLMLFNVEKADVRLIFVPERSKVRRHILSLPCRNGNGEEFKSLHNLKSVNSTLTKTSNKNYFNSLRKSCPILINKDAENPKPNHELLKECSPLTQIFENMKRRGSHRCAGDIIEALVAMQKFNVIQEASNLLAPEDREDLLKTIDKVTNHRVRRNLNKIPNNFVRLSGGVSNADGKKSKVAEEEKTEKYRKKEESAGVQTVDNFDKEDFEEKIKFASKRWNLDGNRSILPKNQGTLIGSCRAARIRDDSSIVHFQENFRVKSLMKVSSFKY